MRIACLLILLVVASADAVPPAGMPVIIYGELSTGPDLGLSGEVPLRWHDGDSLYVLEFGEFGIFVSAGTWPQWNYEIITPNTYTALSAPWSENIVGVGIGGEMGAAESVAFIPTRLDFGWEWMPEKQILLFAYGLAFAASMQFTFVGAIWVINTVRSLGFSIGS